MFAGFSRQLMRYSLRYIGPVIDWTHDGDPGQGQRPVIHRLLHHLLRLDDAMSGSELGRVHL